MTDFPTLAELAAMEHAPLLSALDQARWDVARGLDPEVRHPLIDQGPAERIAYQLNRAPFLEHAWRCDFDPETGRVLTAAWLATGTPSTVMAWSSDFKRGQIMLHNHPGPTPRDVGLRPSEADLNCALEFARDGVGSALVSNDQSHFLLLRHPGFPKRDEDRRTYVLGRPSWQLTFTRIRSPRHVP